MFTQITMIDYKCPLAERRASRKHCGPYQWAPSQPGKGRGFYSGNTALQVDRHGSTFDLRIEDANDHVRGSQRFVNGYYCDEHCDETLQPIIARLPRGRGFLAGWTMGAGMRASLDSYIFADAESAASAAHDAAEYAAEREREYQEEERARLDAEEMEDA